MPVTVTKILMKSLQWYDPDGDVWDDVSGYSPSEAPTPNTTPFDFGPNGVGILLDSYPTGLPITATPLLEIDFAHLTDESETYSDLTIFGSGEQQIALTINSPFIRYKLSTITNDGSADTTTDGNEWYYMMLSADFAADPFVPAGCTSSVSNTTQSYSLMFYFPALSSTEPGITQTLIDIQNSLLQNGHRWRVNLADSNGRVNSAQPYNVRVASPGLTDIVDYGMAKLIIGLDVMGSFPTSDTYTATVQFTSNDYDSWADIPGSVTIVATINPLLASPEEPYVLSLDSDVMIKVAFSQPSV